MIKKKKRAKRSVAETGSKIRQSFSGNQSIVSIVSTVNIVSIASSVAIVGKVLCVLQVV